MNSFKTIYAKYYQALCYFANSLIGNFPAAEDLVQDIFVKLWQKEPDFDKYKNIKALLYISVKNACIDFNRKRQPELTIKGDIKFISQQDEQDSILNKITRAEVLREVYAELHNLPDGCRKVMELYFVEGKNYKEIAAALNIEVATVKTHKARGINALRKKMGPAALLLLLALSQAEQSTGTYSYAKQNSIAWTEKYSSLLFPEPCS